MSVYSRNQSYSTSYTISRIHRFCSGCSTCGVEFEECSATTTKGGIRVLDFRFPAPPRPGNACLWCPPLPLRRSREEKRLSVCQSGRRYTDTVCCAHHVRRSPRYSACATTQRLRGGDGFCACVRSRNQSYRSNACACVLFCSGLWCSVGIQKTQHALRKNRIGSTHTQTTKVPVNVSCSSCRSRSKVPTTRRRVSAWSYCRNRNRNRRPIRGGGEPCTSPSPSPTWAGNSAPTGHSELQRFNGSKHSKPSISVSGFCSEQPGLSILKTHPQ